MKRMTGLFPTPGSIVTEISGASEIPDVRAVEGKTTKPCTCCGKKRRREYVVTGPLFARQLDPDLKEIKPRVSTKPIWKKLCLSWLVCPPNPHLDGEYYEIRIFATCTNRKCPNSGRIRVLEREGYRQFGLIGKWKISIRAKLHLGIDHIIPI